MDRIKRLSKEILQQYKSKFGTDFKENKKTLEEISIVRSKELKNELAGFITKFIKREIRQKEEQLELEKEEKLEKQNQAHDEETISTTQSDSTEEPNQLDEKTSEAIQS